MPATRGEFWRGQRGEAGASAIEFAFILPFVMMLYIGTIDLNIYVSVTRKVANAAGILSDLVTQNTSIISGATIDDAFEGATLAMKPVPADDIGLEIRNYRVVDDVLKLQWNRKSTSGPTCTAPDTTGLRDLMTDGNDIIIAVVCTEHEPAMSKAFGKFPLGAAKFKIESEIKLRPRESTTLDCLDC